MAEPHVVVGALFGAGLASGGLLLGAHVDALALGMIAALLVCFWLEAIDRPSKAAAAVCFASLLAGYGSPAATELALSFAPSVTPAADPLRLLLAILIGGSTPRLVPALLARGAQRAGEL